MHMWKLVIGVDVLVSIGMLLCDQLSCPLSPLVLVLAELQQADPITRRECEELCNISDVVRAQNGKFSQVIPKTADIPKRHGFEEESRLLAGKQSRPHPFVIILLDH